jgi:hypothetical protein
MDAEIPGLASYRELHSLVAEIEALIDPYDPLDVIASFSFENLAYTTDNTLLGDGGQAFVEYVASLCLKKTGSSGKSRSIPPVVIAELQEKIERLFSSVALRRGLRNRTSSPIDKSKRHAELMFLSIRNLDDFDYLEAMLLSLFGGKDESASLLDAHLGFRAAAAARLPSAIGGILDEKLAVRRSFGQDLLQRLRKDLTAQSDQIPDELEQFIGEARTDEEHESALRGYVAKQTFSNFGDIYTFQPSDLAEKLSLDLKGTSALLDAFSIEFGEVAADYILPSSSHEFLFRPLVKSERGYFCPIPDLLLWSLRPRLEELFKANPQVWDLYQKTRGKFLVEQGADLFQRMLPTATILTGLKYWSTQFSKDGSLKEYELDLAVMFNGVLFMVECKGGTLPTEARRGKGRATGDALEDLVMEPATQLDRARRYIDATSSAVFELPSGVSVVIDRASFDLRFVIALTLEDVNFFIADPEHLAILEGFADEHLPWIVNLLTLQAIAQFIQFPAEFVHYVSRRLELNLLKKVGAVEELDYFGCYLECGLHFDEQKFAEFTDVALDGYTEPIEEYRRFETGRSIVPVEKPAQKFPAALSAILIDLQKMNSRAAMQTSILLLDMDGSARVQVANAVDGLREKANVDRQLHDFSILRKDSAAGFTFMVAGDLSRQELVKRLAAWCQIKMKNTGARNWCGITSVVGSRSVADACLFAKV